MVTVATDKSGTTSRREQRKVLAGTMIGTTIEWYDFFIYANAVALVFAQLFFNFGQDGPLAQIIAFLSIGISVIFRPLGSALAGHFGDKLGRKKLLVITLTTMGVATTLMGLLPTSESIGVWAPILLILLRIVQGMSTGGEWAGAALMAVEHAPAKKRGFFGAFPQTGAPLGMLLATGVIAVLTWLTTEEQFLAWGWRIPFLLSVFLIVIGIMIRRTVEESPAFHDIKKHGNVVKNPLSQVFRSHGKKIWQGTWAYAGVNAASMMILAGYLLNYTTQHLGIPVTPVLLMVVVGNLFSVLATLWAGALSDRIGRVKTYQIGFVLLAIWVFPMFWLVETQNMWLIFIAILGICIFQAFAYGQQSAMYVEMFPANVRYTGASISYALGSVIGGAFTATIAEILRTTFSSTTPIAIYLSLWAIIALVVVSTIRDKTGQPLE